MVSLPGGFEIQRTGSRIGTGSEPAPEPPWLKRGKIEPEPAHGKSGRQEVFRESDVKIWCRSGFLYRTHEARDILDTRCRQVKSI